MKYSLLPDDWANIFLHIYSWIFLIIFVIGLGCAMMEDIKALQIVAIVWAIISAIFAGLARVIIDLDK